jgi:hypothetical protein
MFVYDGGENYNDNKIMVFLHLVGEFYDFVILFDLSTLFPALCFIIDRGRIYRKYG